MAAIEFFVAAFGLERRHLNTEENGALRRGGDGRDDARLRVARARVNAPPAGVELTLETDELDAALERALAAGATVVSAPELRAWGQRLAFVRGPEGILIGLTSPPPAG